MRGEGPVQAQPTILVHRHRDAVASIGRTTAPGIGPRSPFSDKVLTVQAHTLERGCSFV